MCRDMIVVVCLNTCHFLEHYCCCRSRCFSHCFVEHDGGPRFLIFTHKVSYQLKKDFFLNYFYLIYCCSDKPAQWSLKCFSSWKCFHLSGDPELVGSLKPIQILPILAYVRIHPVS